MKKNLKYIFLLILVVGISTMVFQILGQLEEKKLKKANRQTLPNFEFVDLNNERFTNAQLIPDKNVLIIYFNPQCDECQYEASEIRENIQQFESTHILMVSNSPQEDVKSFAIEYKIDNLKEISILLDTREIYYEIFDASTVPNLFIYNKEHLLVKQYEGQTKIEAILKYLD
ncbi:MAG: redoxin domain-containing protein [Bacteroidia bacterium]|nr:redoxin domain-containing protein [Bacteroidia bacterium]